MKKFFPLLLLMIFACAASAAEVRTQALTVPVPQGWTSEIDSNGSVELRSPNRKTRVTITAQKAATAQQRQDLAPAAIAGYLSEQLREAGVKTSDVTEKDGVYTFTSEGTDGKTDNPLHSEFRFSMEKGVWSVTIITQNGADDPAAAGVPASIRYR